MATTPQDIKGPIAVTGVIEALPGKADELAQVLANLKARASSDLEPGTLQYNIVRYGDSFAIFEVYKDLEALNAHSSNPLFQEFTKIRETHMKLGQPLFWPVDSLPKPTVQF